MWVASKLSGGTGALVAEAIKLRNWLLRFRCASEELRFIISILADWMANSSSPWYSYLALMACCLVALDKRPVVRPTRIWETLRWALAKLVMRADEDLEKIVCGNLQLYAGLKDGIEGESHTMRQR